MPHARIFHAQLAQLTLRLILPCLMRGRTKHCRRQAFGLEQTERKDREGRQHAKKGIAEEETEETEPEDIVEKIFK